MAEIVNLNRFRKAKARESEDQQAVENRVRFGRSKVEKENDRRAEERRQDLLAGKELEKKQVLEATAGEADRKTGIEPDGDQK